MTTFAYHSTVEHLNSIREIVKICEVPVENSLFSLEDARELKVIREKIITQQVMSRGKSGQSRKNTKKNLGKFRPNVNASSNSSQVEIRRLKKNRLLRNRKFTERTLAQTRKLFSKPLLFLADSRWRFLRWLAGLLTK